MPTKALQVKGRIKDVNGIVVDSATITLTHSSDTLTETTNSIGEYIFNLGDLDSYSVGDEITLAVTVAGKGKADETVTIDKGGNIVDITLEETSDLTYTETELNVHNLVFVVPTSFDGEKITNSNPLPVATFIGINPDNYISKYLKNGSSNDMGIDGSTTPVNFSYTPPSGKKFLVGRCFIYMEAGTAFDSTKFMNLTALTNGVSVSVNGTEITNWKDNIDVTTDMFDTEKGEAYAKTTKVLRCRWSFWKSSRKSSGLLINEGNTFTVTIRDDLSAANIIFKMKVQGLLLDA